MPADYRKAQKSLVGGMSVGTLGANLTRYYFLFGGDAMANEVDARMRVTFPCVITNFHTRSEGPPGAGETFNYRILVSGGLSTLDVGIAGAVDVESVIDADMVTLATGDYVSLRVISSLNAAVQHHSWDLELRH